MHTQPDTARLDAESIVGLAGAVVVDAVALLVRPRMDVGIERRAIQLVGGQVIVIILVAFVAQRVHVEIGLLGVGNVGAVVEVIRRSISIRIGLEAIGRPVLVGVGEALIRLAVTVVVRPVTSFQHGLLGRALELPADALGRADAFAVGVFREALRVPGILVHRLVAVIVLAVADFRGRRGGTAGGQTLLGAMAGAVAGAGVILHEAGRGGLVLDGELITGAFSLSENTLGTGVRGVRIQGRAVVTLRAIPGAGAHRAAVASDAPRVGDAPVPLADVVRVAVGIHGARPAESHESGGADGDEVREGSGVRNTLPPKRALRVAGLGAQGAVRGQDAQVGETIRRLVARIARLARLRGQVEQLGLARFQFAKGLLQLRLPGREVREHEGLFGRLRGRRNVNLVSWRDVDLKHGRRL